jgi:hypothetical protein
MLGERPRPALFAFYEVPTEQWTHIRSSIVIASSFAAIGTGRIAPRAA